MRKLFFIITAFVISLAGCSTFEEPAMEGKSQKQDSRFISGAEACQIATKAFVDFRMEPVSRSSRTAFASLYRPSDRSRSISDTLFYIVNFTEGGFAVVSADRYAKDRIIGISDKGHFEEEGNECLKEYMDYAIWNYPIWRDSMKPHSRDSTLTIPVDTVITYHDRFLPTLWAQGYPYNKYCPVLSNGSHAAVGCVAVAMGQVLAYHRRPEKINGYVMKWSEMLTSQQIYSVSATGEDCIAHLLSECGKLVNMNYGTSSGAYTSDVPEALKKLGFMNAEYHQDLSRCIESLKSEGPVQMRGPGHSWVTDGAKILVMKSPFFSDTTTENYLHMNWGWGGSSDGYFLVKPEYNENNVLGYNYLSYITGVK